MSIPDVSYHSETCATPSTGNHLPRGGGGGGWTGDMGNRCTETCRRTRIGNPGGNTERSTVIIGIVLWSSGDDLVVRMFQSSSNAERCHS
jgi:hypothetical protein